MALSPPEFVRREGGPDAVAEYAEFSRVVGDPAAYLLAELADLHNYGKSVEAAPSSDARACNVRGLNCRRILKWAVFYATSEPCKITIVHVVHLNPRSFEAAESEAESRLRRLT